jgi:hypothetical protein
MKGTRNATIVPHGQHLHVEPAQVEISDVKPNMKYIQTIIVRNLSPFVKRIRCIPPQSQEWTLVSENQTAIAAGLSVAIDVEYLTRRHVDYPDKLIVQAEDFRCEVPLIAKGPCAQIIVPSCVKFDTVKTKSFHQKEITLVNEGTEPGGWELSSTSKLLKFSATSGKLDPRGLPNSQTKIKIDLMTDTPATIYDVIEIKLDGVSALDSDKRLIDVHATCVDQSLHVMLDGKEVDALDFGSLYHGQSKVIRAMLVNNGPTAVNFSAQLTDESAAAAATDRPGGSNDDNTQTGALAASPAETQSKSDQPLLISPFQGQVPAFDRIPLEFSFAPAVYEQSKGWVNYGKWDPEKHVERVTHFKFTGEINSEELGILIPIKLAGEALLPSLRVLPDHLQFGECPVNQRKDIVLRLTNFSKKMSLNYSIPRIPHMEINPMAGTLSPSVSGSSTQQVIVSFTPKALGKCNQDLVIKYCNDLYTHTMRCYADAPIIGEKKPPNKGLERTGRDFDPEHDFVNLENLKIKDRPQVRNVRSLTKIMKTNLVGNLNNSEALNSIIEDLPEPTPYSLSPSAMQEHLRNRQKYNGVVRDSRVQRKRKERLERDGGPVAVDIHFDNDINRGLVPGSGLKSPRYSVDDIKPEKLRLERALDDDSGARGVTGHRWNPDENKMIKKKFKAAPTTQAEVRECSSPLESWQLGLITVGPRMLDFGTMYVRSQATKSFSVFNDLPQAILLAIQYDSENELNKSTPISQVVPSAQPAGFDVTMCSTVPQTVQRQIVYTINGLHAFKFSVHAEITPVQIQMTRTEITFRFAEDSLERTLTESVVLKNPGNAPARFVWEGVNQHFSVHPDKGVIRQGATVACEVTFTPPTTGQHLENFLTLKTEDGDDQALRVSGQVPDASSVSFALRRLDLGVLAVGFAFDKSITVKNDGKQRAVFHVDGLAEGLAVNPSKGHIAPDSKVELDVHVLLDRPMQLDTSLTLNIRGGKPIKLGIVATAVVPNIEFVEDEIDFGQLTLAAMTTRPLSLKNTSAVDGTLYVNLQPYPEFVLSLVESEKSKEEGVAEEGEFDSSVLQPMTLQQYHYQIGTSMDAGATGGNAAGRSGALMGQANGAQSPTGDEEDEEANSQIYKISVQPNFTLQMQLSYTPTDLGTHQFEFPIVAADGVRSEGLKKIVRAEALRPRMLFSNTIMDFKTKVVATGVQAAATVKELGLHNADDNVIDWEIDVDDKLVKQGIFAIEPTRGTLRPEQECLVRVSFMPAEPMEYKSELDVFMSPPRNPDQPADEYDSQQPLPPDHTKRYLSLRLRGCGTVPKLTFDRKEIVLPIVPLNVRSRYLFHVVNEGYESLEVKFRLPTDTHRIPLTINFPEGQQLGITKPKIPVEVFFESSKPISFCAKIEFLDNDTGVYPLPISGTAENSILTCHRYLADNVELYHLDGDPVQLREKEDPAAGELAPSVKTGSVSHQSIAGYAGQDTSQADFLIRWMNSNVLRNTIDNFPQDLLAGTGRQLYDMIEFLSGKSVPQGRARVETGGGRGNMGSSGRSRNREMIRIHALMGQYEAMLTFLKSHGGLLASVKPEHFLSLDQYLRFQQTQYPGTKRHVTEKAFYPKSVESWLTCILQTIKIFLLNRITPRHYKALPGLTEVIDQPVSSPIDEGMSSEQLADTQKKLPAYLQAFLNPGGLTESNICSVAECILLRWLNFHFFRANKERYDRKAPVCTFDTDLEDSIVLSVVIESHVPNCQAVKNMKYPAGRLEDLEENAMQIVAALQEIGLQFPIQPGDIASPNPKDMLLFVMFLFQNLPHYVPKTVIVFATMLGVSKTQNIELTNPSRRAITYYVTMEGSSDFVIKEESVRIEPKQTVSFPVEYQSRFSRQVEAQITFTSKREGNVHAAAMRFMLRSRCTGRRPRRTEHVAAVLYEVGTVDIDLENPFAEDADFQLSLREMTVCDADKNPVKSKRCEGIDPFYLSTQRVRVRANGTSKVTVSFVPFDAPAYFTALIGFFDSKAGEFYYELFGKSTPPSPLDTYKLSVKAEENGFKELILPHKNMQMDRQRSNLESKGAAVKQVLPDTIVYDVKLSSPFYTAPRQVTVVNVTKLSQEKGDGKGGGRGPAPPATDRRPSADPKQDTKTSVAKLTIEFKPKEPGVYPCKVTLTSDVDIRVYQIEGTGTAPNTQCSLVFNTQARKSVTQEIPIVNQSDREWIVKAIYSPAGHEFDGPREFTAKRRQANGMSTTSHYLLTFKPDWVCNVHGNLSLINQGTGETYEYELHGIAEEPLAEEHVIIRCEAREKAHHKFLVKNYLSTPATFEVESDLVHISGASSVQVQGKDSAEYELAFQPLQAGQVTGCIMFRDTSSGHFTWYTVELHTDPPKPQQALTLTCEVRRAVAVDIKLVNPLDDVIVFDVALNGDGLLGEAEFVLAPKETATYELVFSPLQPSRKKGTAVFFNTTVGEFWYDLDLIADPAPPEELELLKCELGRTQTTSVRIENPTGQEVVLKHRSTNKINFKIIQQRVVLPALEHANVAIEYSPSSLGEQEEANIFFEHPVVGSWAYKVTGIGLPPDEAKQLTVVAQVSRPVSSTITFKNPFLDTIHALIVLDSKSEKGVFSLLNKKAKVQIGPLATTQIPFSFCPPTMTQHSAEITVSVVKPNLTWTYAIQGVAEAPTDSTLHTFMIQAREVLETTYCFTLAGLDAAPLDPHTDALSVALEVPPQFESRVKSCFSIELEDYLERKPKDKKEVGLKVRFAPLRPFVAMCNLVITRASGGRWRFDLKLEATEPEVDDTISIQSPLNKPASVAFRLCNHTGVYANFDAFFDAESAYEFTVQPTSGVLEPQGKTGTTFVITYKPTEYGKPVQGKLIIQTEDVYWSYRVRGTHPKYTAPVADKAKVTTRLSKDVQAHMANSHAVRRGKNFIRDNMAAAPSGVLRD